MGWFDTRGSKERKAAFRNAVAVALADGVLDAAEMEALALVAQRLKLSKSEMKAVLNAPEKVKFVAPRDPEEGMKQLVDIIIVMMADGVIDEREATLCAGIATALGYHPDVIPTLLEAIVKAIRENRDPVQDARDVT